MVSNEEEEECATRQVTPMGEVYYVNKYTNEKIIKPTIRPDGSIRKEIKVRPGYTPLEEQGLYVPRARQKARENASKNIPATHGRDDPLANNSSKASAGKKNGNTGRNRSKKTKEGPDQLFNLIRRIETVKISNEQAKKEKRENNSSNADKSF